MKSTVHVKSIPSSATKVMKHHVRGRFKDNFPDTVILHFGTNNLKNNESTKDIATDIMNLAISVKNVKKNCSDKLNDKGKNVNSLLKRK